MKKILFSLIIIIITSLSLNLFSQNFILYGAKEKYFLNNLEASIAVDTLIVSKYDKYNFSLQHQVPIQRYISSTSYNLFIGLAINDTPSSILELYLNYNQYEILASDTLYFKRKPVYKVFIKNKNEYLYKVIFKSKKSYYTAVLTFVSFEKAIIENLYLDENLFLDKLRKKIKNK
ncbi:MAG: hypothetical protein JXR68_04555 [Bacteroidales bacterium]|nr:hypothetical protein [Bacteroidales bacterium]